MSVQKKTAVGGENPRSYYYYPAKEKGKPRVVVAGVVENGCLKLGEARCHPGNKGEQHWFPKLQILMELFEDGVITGEELEQYGPRLPIKPDQFSKGGGRRAALDRACSEKAPKEGSDSWRRGPVACITIPEERMKDQGRFFKEECEKRYPLMAPKSHKAQKAPISSCT